MEDNNGFFVSTDKSTYKNGDRVDTPDILTMQPLSDEEKLKLNSVLEEFNKSIGRVSAED